MSVDSSFIGWTYSVLNKRKACNIEEESNELSNLFTIKADLPLVESLGFDEDLRSATQGKSDYQLTFNLW